VGRLSRTPCRTPARFARPLERNTGRVERCAARCGRRAYAAVIEHRACRIVTDPQRYLAIYLAPLATRVRKRRDPAAPPPLDLCHWSRPEAHPVAEALSLPQLFTAGVDGGNAEARSELKRRVAAIDAAQTQLQDGESELAPRLLDAMRSQQAMQHQIERGEQMLGAARARIVELETSTTWRATAPLRESGHRVKIAWAHARAQWSALRQSPHYVGVAASVLRNEGPGALAKRIVRRLSRPHRYVPPP